MGYKIGWIGLGIMGAPMASNLLKAGFSVMAYDIKAEAVDAICAKGAEAATLQTIGESCDIIVTILPNGLIVRDVLCGEGGILPYVKPGALVIDMSSVTAADSRFCAEKLSAANVSFLDAPVSGGEEGAIHGTLAIMVGGDVDSFEKASSVFHALGKTITLVGPVGSGSITKLANQIIVNLNIAAVSEALILAKKAGVDPERVFMAIRGGLAGSQVLEDKAPRMIEHNFAPGGALTINHKDIKNVLQTAHDFDVPLPMCSLLHEIMISLRADGRFDEDHSAIVRFYEKLAGTKINK